MPVAAGAEACPQHGEIPQSMALFGTEPRSGNLLVFAIRCLLELTIFAAMLLVPLD